MVLCKHTNLVVSVDTPFIFKYTFPRMHVFAHCCTIMCFGLLVVSSMWFGGFSMAYFHMIVVPQLPFVRVVE